MLRLKDSSVNPTGIKNEMMIALMVADEAMQSQKAVCVITSINDGRHSAKSRHYIGMAVDLRSRHLDDVGKMVVLNEMRSNLPGYDVLLEGKGTPNEHFHLEYDPRR
jgi:hypothetical protein